MLVKAETITRAPKKTPPKRGLLTCLPGMTFSSRVCCGG